MGSKVGLWIDHRKAQLLTISDKGVAMTLTISGVEKQLRRSGDSPLKGSFEALQVPADDVRQRAFTAHLKLYYDAVIAAMADAESILIFGPGEAKGELKKRLQKRQMGDRIVGVEAADKMTSRQIAAKVRRHYAG